MFIRPAFVFAVIWAGWALSWIAAALWSARTEKKVVTWEVWVERLLVIGGAVLLWHGTARRLGERRLWHPGLDGAYALAAVTLIGFVIAWWARLHLGRLWSGTITRKQDHYVVDTGPYRLVRHPIYTGLILSLVASAAAQATVSAAAGTVLISVGLWLKARIEERFLTAELGEQAYGRYRDRVPMLIPLLKPRRSGHSSL